MIGGRIETSVRFMEEYCYCQSYYCQPIAKTEEKSIKAARICNYMNLHLHWDCNTLFEHNYFFNEEDGDLFNGCLIRYELLDAYFQEAMDYILNFSVQQKMYAYQLFSILRGNIRIKSSRIISKLI